MFLSGGSPREGARSELVPARSSDWRRGAAGSPDPYDFKAGSCLAPDQAPEGVDLVGAEGYGDEGVEGGAGADA